MLPEKVGTGLMKIALRLLIRSGLDKEGKKVPLNELQESLIAQEFELLLADIVKLLREKVERLAKLFFTGISENEILSWRLEFIAYAEKHPDFKLDHNNKEYSAQEIVDILKSDQNDRFLRLIILGKICDLLKTRSKVQPASQIKTS